MAAAFGGYSPDTQTGYADIGKVVVGTADTARGITGDIIAHTGTITSIFSTGPIGTVTDEAKLWASDGIDEIRIISENTASAVLDEDLFVNIDAGKLNLNPSSNQTLGPSFTNAPLGPEQDGSIRLIETGGDLHGSVHATNISTDFNETQHFGILVRGDIHAPITIDYMMNYADIIGRSIQAPVIIGKQLKGAIVAFGTPDPGNPSDLAGTIHSIRVGLDAPAFASAFGTGFPSPPASVYPTFKPGLIGLAEPPHDISNANPLITWFPSMGNDGGTLDGLIRAEKSIGSVELASISLQHPTGGKSFRPRVEAPVIGSLRVHEEIEAGSIWSGQLDFVNGQVADDIVNNYARIESLQVGCVGRKGDIWFQDCALAITDVNMLGELHLPHLNADEQIWIGQYLGDSANVCGQVPSTQDPSEQSPRGYRTNAGEPSGGLADRGGIFVLEPEALTGQIIVNGDTPFETDGWKGLVMIGADQLTTPLPSGTIVLDPTLSQPDLAPYYERISDNVGDGAAGLAPFHLYDTDCEPPHDPTGTDTGIDEAVLNGLGGQVLIRFYGPIQRLNPTDAWHEHIQIKARPYPLPCPPPWAEQLNECLWIDVSTAFNVQGPTSTTTDALSRRTLKLTPKNGNYVAPGVYMVHPVDPDSVLCADVAGNPPVAWSLFMCDEEAVNLERLAYGFVVSGDCDGDSIPDQDDCDPGEGCDTDCNVADFNHSGTVTVQDIFDFLAAYFAGCMGNPSSPCNGADADVNNSNSLSVQDIFDYLTAYFGATGC